MKTCGSCVHCVEVRSEKTGTFGNLEGWECRRFPPKNEANYSMFPKIRIHLDFCGEHKEVEP